MKIGIDILEIRRIRDKLRKNSSLENKLFTDYEKQYCRKFSDPYPHFAVTFAAKEAFIKCIGKNPGWKKIEIRREEAPYVVFEGRKVNGSLSLAHSETSAVAVFLLLE
ncbi:MAG: 4'-phosphopantetheinyl transferase superfamily protein [Candidatus Aminicenantes bacterium]|nr:4'-phosphopantetheinyl transferase superfamily protein [Candidatus Aminicenantes bacterium]